MMKKISGKKKASGAAAATATDAAGDLKKVRGDWQRSSVTERQLEALRRDGVLPPLEKMATRVPGDEVAPHPRDGERVCFVDFVNRGFAFPVHEFVRGLMYAYGVQLHDFTPNSILHISCFITLCECFLGIHLLWGLWQRIFNVKRNTGPHGVYPIGGFGIQIGRASCRERV